MKSSLKVLGSRDIKFYREYIKNQWGADFDEDFVFLYSNKDRIYLADKGVGLVDWSKMRINTVGLYFGEMHKGVLRLSIEGSQLVGPLAAKNIAVIPDDMVLPWFRGNDIPFEGEGTGFVLVKNKNDFLGCGHLKEGKILNFVPKARRLTVADLP